jgi:hypothetical protein
MRYHGQMALQIGLLVAFMQLIPEHQVQLFGVFRVRVKVRLEGAMSQLRLIPYSRFQWPMSHFLQ